MNKGLCRRLERLERTSQDGADVARAAAVCEAYEIVRDHPELATHAERALAAATSHEDWQRALITLIEADGGLEAVVEKACAMTDDEIGLNREKRLLQRRSILLG